MSRDLFSVPVDPGQERAVTWLPCAAGGGRERACCRCGAVIDTAVVWVVTDPEFAYRPVCAECANSHVTLRVWQARCDAGNAIERALAMCTDRDQRQIFLDLLVSDCGWFANWRHPDEPLLAARPVGEPDDTDQD